MTCYVFGAAPVMDLSWIEARLHKKPEDLLICADGGYHLAVRLGLTPDWLVGDFDSISEHLGGQNLDVPAERILRFDPQKDDTDLALSLAQGRMLGYTDFVIYGATGGRFDHDVGMVQLLCGMVSDPDLTVRVEGEYSTYFCLKNNSVTLQNFDAMPPHRELVARENRRRRTFSVFSLDPESTHVSITGAVYELVKASLFYDRPLGISNQIAEDTATIEVGNGTLLIVAENIPDQKTTARIDEKIDKKIDTQKNGSA